MKKELEELYKLEITSLIKLTNKTYKVITSREEYILKEHDSLNLESIFARIRILNIDTFVLPLRSIDEHYIV